MNHSKKLSESEPPQRFVKSPYLAAFDGDLRLENFSTQPPKDSPGKKELEDGLEKNVKELEDIQEQLYSDGRYAVMWNFQAMDAAGKDGTIKATTRGINPAGVSVVSFKAPSSIELAHDFLWRSSAALPRRGQICATSRSSYEEMLVVRVHPEFLAAQNIPDLPKDRDQIFADRFVSQIEWEKHLARNGYVIAKFFLHVSKKEQAKRLLARIKDPKKQWKFNPRDFEERKLWDQYQKAYEDVLKNTSVPWAPWYIIPADDKDYMRLTVSSIQLDLLKRLELKPPRLPKSDAEISTIRSSLEKELEK